MEYLDKEPPNYDMRGAIFWTTQDNPGDVVDKLYLLALSLS
jgi:hypothetical protein